jgi:hypothetical protein
VNDLRVQQRGKLPEALDAAELFLGGAAELAARATDPAHGAVSTHPGAGHDALSAEKSTTSGT